MGFTIVDDRATELFEWLVRLVSKLPNLAALKGLMLVFHGRTFDREALNQTNAVLVFHLLVHRNREVEFVLVILNLRHT